MCELTDSSVFYNFFFVKCFELKESANRNSTGALWVTQNIEPGASDFCVQDRSKSLSSIRIHTGAIRITKRDLLLEK